MRYKKWNAACLFDNGEVRKIEVLAKGEEVRLFCENEELPRLATGTPKSAYVPGATSAVTDSDNVFDLGGGNYVSIKSCGRYRPIVTAIDGLARMTLGMTEIVTITVASVLFAGLILLAVLL